LSGVFRDDSPIVQDVQIFSDAKTVSFGTNTWFGSPCRDADKAWCYCQWLFSNPFFTGQHFGWPRQSWRAVGEIGEKGQAPTPILHAGSALRPGLRKGAFARTSQKQKWQRVAVVGSGWQRVAVFPRGSGRGAQARG
jgi:hypothetical protein